MSYREENRQLLKILGPFIVVAGPIFLLMMIYHAVVKENVFQDLKTMAFWIFLILFSVLGTAYGVWMCRAFNGWFGAKKD